MFSDYVYTYIGLYTKVAISQLRTVIESHVEFLGQKDNSESFERKVELVFLLTSCRLILKKVRI